MRIFQRIRNNWLSASVFAGLVVTVSVATGTVNAHETFLLPARSTWNVGDTVEVRMASGLAFPDLKWAITRDRVSATVLRLGGQPVARPALNVSDTYLNISFMAQHPGTGVIAVSTRIRSGDIEPESTEMYLDEIGASQAVREAFRALPGDPPLHRSYAKHTKALICVEQCNAGDGESSSPVGQALEFIVVPGATNRFQLLRASDPLAHHEVQARTSAGILHKFTTDEKGQMTVGGDISGMVMLAAVAITLPEQPDGLYHSDYATLVVGLAQAQDQSR